jgi:hypothetical protein
MEVTGIIKRIENTQEVGSKGFKKRDLIIETQEQYPQTLGIQFVQDKCAVLDKYTEGQTVEIGINLRGREWTKDNGETVVFNTIQGWKISKVGDAQHEPTQPESVVEEPQDDSPF